MVKRACVGLVLAQTLAAVAVANAAGVPRAAVAERHAQFGNLRPAVAPFRALEPLPRKIDASPRTLPEFSNPLKRKRMAMPAVPEGDLGF